VVAEIIEGVEKSAHFGELHERLRVKRSIFLCHLALLSMELDSARDEFAAATPEVAGPIEDGRVLSYL
jgi:hypothetical protein